MLHMRVLQALAMDADGVQMPLPRSRRARSLLSWMALHPGLHPRARLAERFWPDVREAAARNSFRQTLWELRGALGEHARHLVSTREVAGLVPGPGLWVDLWEFRSCVAEGRLDDALELANGVLVDDIDDEWAYEAREDHRRELVAVVSRAAAAAESGGDLGRAVERSRWVVALDPYGEAGHRHLMLRLAAAGDVPGAIAVYGRFRERLRNDLGLPVSQETSTLAERLGGEMREASMHAVSPAPPVIPGAVEEPLVGRDEELAHLVRLLDVAAAGRRVVVLIEGDPGIGKTRLAVELCRTAQSRGAAVLFGRCSEETLVPYQPFVEALRRHVLTSPAADLHDALPAGSGELVHLLPEVEARFPGAVTHRGADTSGTDRFRLFEAVVGLVHGIARSTPAVLVLDDLHWADRPSLLLLRHLVRSPAQAALLVIGTYRGGELDANAPLLDALADLRHGAVQHLHLRGLTTSGVAALVSRRTGQNASGELVRVIERRTGGNPFFISELLRNLTESGALSVGDSGPVWDLASRDAVIPEAVSEVIFRRISRLGDDARRLLQVGSVIGQEFPRDIAVLVAAVDHDDVLDPLDSAVRARLLVERSSAPGWYEFVHPLVREVLYYGLTVNRRARLHQQVGEALEMSPSGTPSSAELARHFLLADSVETAGKAVACALKAADQAIRQRAYEEAVSLLDQALDRLPAGDRHGRRHILSRRAIAHTAAIHSIIDPGRLPTTTASEIGGQ